MSCEKGSQTLGKLHSLSLPLLLEKKTLTISFFPECLETAEDLASVLTGRYGQTVPGDSLSSRQLIFQIITYFLHHC